MTALVATMFILFGVLVGFVVGSGWGEKERKNLESQNKMLREAHEKKADYRREMYTAQADRSEAIREVEAWYIISDRHPDTGWILPSYGNAGGPYKTEPTGEQVDFWRKQGYPNVHKVKMVPADALRTLTAERDRLEEAANYWRAEHEIAARNHMEDAQQVDKLEAENERLREDAERMDWLSARGNFEVEEYVGGGTALQWLGYEHEADNLRKAIDAARRTDTEEADDD